MVFSQKKILGFALIAALAFTGCSNQGQSQQVDTALPSAAVSTSSSPWSPDEQQQALAVSASVLGLSLIHI